jgi:exopolysaccharide production protein ExoZ
VTERNQSLDLLRGVAILLVVLVHCAQVTTSIVPGLGWFATHYGELGVPLFFIVSGYTMMLTFGDRADLAATRSFYIRRVFRIAPLFWAAIFLYLLLTKGEGFKAWAPAGVSASDILLTFFFLHGSSVTAFNSVVPGGWSIAVEMQFYLLFPLIIYLFRRRNGPVFCYAFIALLSAVGQFAAQRYLVPQMAASLPGDQAYLADAFFYCWLPHQSVCFGFGILLHDTIEQKKLPTLGVLFLVGACLSSSWGGLIVILAAISFAVLALNVTNSFMSLLGRHSYAIYLTHFALISGISALFSIDLVPMLVLITGLSLAVSYYVTEPLIERRFNRLGHVLASRVRRPKTVATTA